MAQKDISLQNIVGPLVFYWNGFEVFLTMADGVRIKRQMEKSLWKCPIFFSDVNEKTKRHQGMRREYKTSKICLWQGVRGFFGNFKTAKQDWQSSWYAQSYKSPFILLQ